MNNNLQHCTIWMDTETNPLQEGTQILWNDFNKTGAINIISIPELIEQNGDLYRKRYLDWMEELSETVVANSRFFNRMKIRRDLNYWWFTDIAIKKSAFNSPPEIINTVKLFVLEDILFARNITHITVEGAAGFALRKVIRQWCQATKQQLVWQNDSGIKMLVQGFFYSLHPVSESIKAFAWLGRYIIKKITLFKGNKSPAASNHTDILWVNYFANLRKQAIEGDAFSSSYWDGLPSLADEKQLTQQWVHLFIPTPDFPSERSAQRKLNEYNKGRSLSVHNFLENSITAALFFRVIRDCFFLLSASLFTPGKQRLFHKKNSQLRLWPLYKKSWQRSFTGISAIENMLCLGLFEKKLSQPTIKVGIYLQENQAWEIAFKYAWRKNGHGKLVGVPHSSVRFWDLRYFYGTQTGALYFPKEIIFPDITALNGEAAMQNFDQAGNSVPEIRAVEALRYLYLLNMQETNVPKAGRGKMLVLTDYDIEVSNKQMKCLAEAVQQGIDTGIQVKPHPACPVSLEKYNIVGAELTNAPLSELMRQCDTVFTSNTTSSAVEAMICGLKVICMLDGTTFNMSPLRKFGNINFVSSASELAAHISNRSSDSDRNAVGHFFFLDAGLPGWRVLLEEALHPSDQ